MSKINLYGTLLHGKLLSLRKSFMFYGSVIVCKIKQQIYKLLKWKHTHCISIIIDILCKKNRTLLSITKYRIRFVSLNLWCSFYAYKTCVIGQIY